MKKIKLKKKLRKTKIIITITIISCLSSIYLLEKVSSKIAPPIFKYAEAETKKVSNIIINDAIAKTITKKNVADDMFEITKDPSNEIKTVDFNTISINKYLTQMTKYIKQDLLNLEKGTINKRNIFKEYNEQDLKKGIITYAKPSLIFKNPIFANIGPKIPIKLGLAGDIISYTSAEVDSYGINNTLIKVFINLKITEKIIIPFYDKNINMEAKVPIAIKMINGTVPEYYFGGSESKKIVVPK